MYILEKKIKLYLKDLLISNRYEILILYKIKDLKSYRKFIVWFKNQIKSYDY